VGPLNAPVPLRPIFPVAGQSRGTGTWRKPRDPYCLARDPDDWLAIRELGGVEKLLGTGSSLVAAVMASPPEVRPEGVGLVADADDVGVAPRVDALRARFGSSLPGLSAASPGMVVPGPPRSGVWIAPDNAGCGSLLDVLEAATVVARPTLLASAIALVARVAPLADAAWRAKHEPRKAALGIVGQADDPGGPLAGALRVGDWIGLACAADPKVMPFVDFLRAITACR